MHILIVIAFLAILIFLFYQFTQSRDTSSNEFRRNVDFSSATGLGKVASGLEVAFISNGNLFYQADGGEVTQVHSPYIQNIQDRMERSRDLHAWKQNTSFGISGSGKLKQFDSGNAQIAVTSIQFERNKTMLYFLKDTGIGGLFSHDLESGTEKRLLHKQNLDLADLKLNQASGKILCTSYAKGGIANIAMLHSDGSQFCELTGGDTVDTAPCWTPGEDKIILYQSAGLARDENGYVLAQGNASIQMLNLSSGKITPVMDDPTYDYLHPRVCPQGRLHFIRRPYEVPKYATGNILLDAVLFPFRLLRAVFHFLNFFSLMYSRKPLTGASGPALQADIKDIILKGKRIDAEKALREETKVNGVSSLVPRSWELVSRTRQGVERVLATNVVSYDITSDGHVIYSNGRGVFLLNEQDQSELILKSDLVGDVVAERLLAQAGAAG